MNLLKTTRSNARGAIDCLKAREMLYHHTPLKSQGEDFNLREGIYCGFDPTSCSLHLGNLMTLLGLRHFEQHGFRTFALIGGATGLIGDPSGKHAERDMSHVDRIAENSAALTKQIQSLSFLDARVVNNLDWFSNINCLQVQ